jgi:hypothetical protein
MKPANYDSPLQRLTIKMQCFPLYSLLLAVGNPKVDYLSLDIEGAELLVLKTIPWDKVSCFFLTLLNHTYLPLLSHPFIYVPSLIPSKD